MTRAERRRMQREGNSRRRLHGRWIVGATVLLTLVFVVFLMKVRGQEAGVEVLYLSEDEVHQLANEMLNSVNPQLPENEYMPPFMREKLGWIFESLDSGMLELNILLDRTDFTTGEAVLAFADNEGGVSRIWLNGAALWVFVRIRGGMEYGFSRQNKNDFALILVHEATHLERRLDLQAPLDSLIAEEVRVYRKVNFLAVRPLREQGEPMDAEHHLLVDDLLRQCGDEAVCPAFYELIAKLKTAQQEKK
jgi:hypothetical protein